MLGGNEYVLYKNNSLKIMKSNLTKCFKYSFGHINNYINMNKKLNKNYSVNK